MTDSPKERYAGPTITGYELEVRPYRGLWSRFEGRVIRLSRWTDVGQLYRDHYFPGGGVWARARTSERLQLRLRNGLKRALARERDKKPRRIKLEDTMGGWM